MNRTLVLEYARVTEAAAIAASSMIGRGDGEGADQRAVTAMRDAFERVNARGTIVIGEGERDEAPMLYIGEKVGPHDPELPEVDIAVDPLEGTNLCSSGGPGAMAVLAVAKKGDLLHAPDTYMYKIATGPEGKGVVHLEMSPTENLRALAAAKGRRTDEMTVVVLDRPRHQKIIQDLRDAGARIMLVSDGDVAPAVATCIPKSGVDMVVGTGGAPEGVLAASALLALDGEFFGQLRFRSDEERERAKTMGFLDDVDKIMRLTDLVRGDVIFVATGVTTGHLLKGVRRIGDYLHLQTMALRSKTGTIRMVETQVNARRFPYQYVGRL
ncbi:MAG TPA: class II fructose-bisphosphatase [Nannocystis exedens]|nr:class II fructose-bisphosphatase [Nannocystis exedens]